MRVRRGASIPDGSSSADGDHMPAGSVGVAGDGRTGPSCAFGSFAGQKMTYAPAQLSVRGQSCRQGTSALKIVRLGSSR